MRCFKNCRTSSRTAAPLPRRLLSLLCIFLALSAVRTSIAQSVNTIQFQDEHSLLAAMVSVQSPQESRILMTSHKKLLTEKLWAMLKEEIDKNFVSEDYPRALFLAEIGKQIAEELQDKKLLPLILNRIAYIHLMMADYHKAIEYGMQCLAAMKGLDNNLVLVNVLLTLGISSLKQGDHARALEYLQKALTSAGTIADKTYAADALLNLGHAYTNIGDFFKALNHYNQAVAIINTLKDSGRLEDALNELGILYAEQGDYEKAIDYLNQSLKIAKQTDDQRGIASVLVTMGIVHREQADLGTAIHKLEEALKISEENRFTDLASYARTNCASVYKLQGKYQLALAYYKKSLADAEQAGDRQLKAGTLWHLADLHNTTKEHQTALEYANESIAIAAQISLPEILYLALTEKGKAQKALHQIDLAEQSFLRAISTIEELRDQVSGGEPDYQKFLQNRVAPYYCMIDLLVNRNRSADALAFAERVKARVLLDVLRDGRVHINKSLTQGEEMKERELHNELVSTNTQLRAERSREAPDVSHVNDLESRLQRARGAYEEFQTSLYAAHPELKIRRAILPPFTTLDAAAAIPDQRTAVLEYVVADSYTLLFLISRSSVDKVDIKAYRIDITRAALAKQAETLRKILATNLPGYRQPSRDLYTLLIGPASQYLKDKTTLCIVPDGPLWQLPFQALETPEEKFLLERHAIYYAPSLLVLHEMKRKATQLRSSPVGNREPKDNAELLAVANPATNSEVLAKAHAFTRGDLPPMPETEDEVKQIASESYRSETSRVLIGAAAREETVKAQISKYHVLHFATHSVLDDRHPLYSYLLLTTDGHSNEDGLLEAWEIMGMELNAEMAVLSACDTARGRVGAGEGLIGMTWALFVAGVPTTVASQWAVPSNTTAKLMVAFHENVKRVPKAEALRQAALQMIKDQRFRMKPYYWAGFIVLGHSSL